MLAKAHSTLLRMMMDTRTGGFAVLLTLLWSCAEVRLDVAHFFAPLELGNYVQGQHPFQVALPPPAVQALYGPAVLPPSTTEFSLPEIVENRIAKTHGSFIPLSQHYLPPSYESPKPTGDDSGGGYYYPQPASSTTAPPIIVQDPGLDSELELQPPASSPGYDYTAPSTPAPVYLPPDQSIESSGEQPLRLRLKQMRCLQSGYFRSVLKLHSLPGIVPSVDNVAPDKRCELRLSGSFVVVDIAAADFERCGVQACGQDLCLRLRFPLIRGMRTGSDGIVTLHCKTQERVAVKTHALKMGVANDVQARSSGSYAHGGLQNAFRTHVELLRRGSTGYTRHLETNGAVQLGEELLLRAHVLAGDGWNYTKLSDVQLQRISPAGELLNSAQLITARGCLNPAMQSICAHAPSYEPPLGQRLHFKAVMFQGMRSGETLVMSMRITGCLEREDCQQDCRAGAEGASQRRRRNVAAAADDNEASQLSQLTFRVMLPGSGDLPAEQQSTPTVQLASATRSVALLGSVAFVVLLLALALLLAYKLRRR